MIENPSERKAKESAREISQRKHDATLLRQLITKEDAHIRYANAQCSLHKAKQNFQANPTKKTYRFLVTAHIRALP